MSNQDLEEVQAPDVVISPLERSYVEHWLDPGREELSKVFSSVEMRRGVDLLVNLRGLRAAGKSQLQHLLTQKYPTRLRTACLAMVRPLRSATGGLPAEVNGYDFISLTEQEHDQALAQNAFLFAGQLWDFVVDPQTGESKWKATRFGVFTETIREVVSSGVRAITIFPPGVDYYLSKIFPLTGCIVLATSMNDYELYMHRRELLPSDNPMANRLVAIYDPDTWIKGTLEVANARWQMAVRNKSPMMQAIEDYVLQPRIGEWTEWAEIRLKKSTDVRLR